MKVSNKKMPESYYYKLVKKLLLQDQYQLAIRRVELLDNREKVEEDEKIQVKQMEDRERKKGPPRRYRETAV